MGSKRLTKAVIKDNFFDSRSNLPPFWLTIRESLLLDASRKQRDVALRNYNVIKEHVTLDTRTKAWILEILRPMYKLKQLLDANEVHCS